MHGMAAEQLGFRPLSESMGVEVTGIDLRRPISQEQQRRLSDAFDRHHLLLVRGQDITPEQQAAFGRIFGQIALRERNRIKNEVAETQHVSNKREDGVFGQGELDFHIDQLFQEEPLNALILYAIEVPDEGGDTRFSNAMAAYEQLPEAVRRRADGLQCRHAYMYSGDLAKSWNMEQADENAPTAVHPMMWQHPPSGRKAVWVNKLTTVEVLGMPADEAAELMEQVRKPLYEERNCYTHKWRPGDLLLWNNKTLQHARTPFDNGQPRTLRRTPIV